MKNEKQKLVNEAKVNIQHYEGVISKLKSRLHWLAFLRFVFFAGIVAAIFFFPELGTVGFIILELVLVLVFLLLLSYNSKLKHKKCIAAELLQINTEWDLSLNENFDSFHGGKEFVNPQHDYTYDTDIFGRNSLFSILNRTVTVGGKIRLAEKLSKINTDSKKINKQQEAVGELAEMPNFRQNFAAYARCRLKDDDTYENETQDVFLNELKVWAAGENFIKGNRFIEILLYLLPLATIALGVLWLAGVLGWSLFVMSVFVQFGVLFTWTKRINSAHSALSQKSKQLSVYEGLMKRISEQNFRSDYLQNSQKPFHGQSNSALSSLKQLRRLLKAFDIRLNMIVSLILNSLLIWDLQVLLRLEHLKTDLSNGLPKWFNALSEFDAMMSLADFAYSNPDYVFPETEAGDFFVEIKNGSHPLLPSESRVGNDFEIFGLGKLFIITGANMSGKSTFLRMAAVNMILASVGTKVCADYMRYRPIPIYTSVRTTDSVQKNESYFYAELMRLKQMTDRLKAGEELFVILDEMLKGTNSEDKHTGSKGLLEQMVQYRVAGLAATHDTDLGKLEDAYPDQIFNRRFEAEIKSGELFFDYKIKQGISRNLNAVFLMKKYGIIPSKE